jgi:hypothetical protein
MFQKFVNDRILFARNRGWVMKVAIIFRQEQSLHGMTDRLPVRAIWPAFF